MQSDDDLPTRTRAEVRAADAFIDLCALCARHGLDLEGTVRDRLSFRQGRGGA
jgi:hypothetical protein